MTAEAEGKISVQQPRIRSLDFLRGLAILGMLVANIPWHAGDSMSRVIEPDITSVSAWLAQYLIFDQRFMPIFCMLFGAGAVLLARSTNHQTFTRFYTIRMGLLFFIGVLHAYLLWPGDILITYAVCSPFVFLALHWSPTRLFITGLLLKCVSLIFAEWPIVYESTIQRLLFAWWVDYGEAPGTIVKAYAGNYRDLLAYNAWRNQFIQWTALPYFRIWNALGFMLIGMGLFKIGIIQGDRPSGLYRRLAWSCLIAGSPLVVYGVLARIGVNPTVGPYFGFEQQLPYLRLTFNIGCALTSFALLAFALLFYKRYGGRPTLAIERVGRMAMSNYLMHSLIFLLIFHSFELLPFDQLDHDVMLLLVVSTWALQIVVSTLWLHRYQQGPVEAIWRSATKQLI